MKYFLSSFLNSVKENYKVILLYFWCLIFYTIFNINIGKSTDIGNIYIKSLGLYFDNDFIEILFYVLCICVCVYSVFRIFYNIIKCGEFLLTRIKKKTVVIYYLIMLFVFLCVLKILSNVIVSLLIGNNIDFHVLVCDILFSFIICLYFIILVISTKQMYLAILILLLSFTIAFIVNKMLLFPLTYKLIVLIIISSVLLIICLLISNKMYQCYERMNLK